MAALAAVVVIVAVVGSRFAATPAGSGGSGGSPSSTPSALAVASSLAAPSTLAAPSGSATQPIASAPPAPATFTTPGVATNWTGFTWSTSPSEIPIQVAGADRILPWRGGYVAYGTANGSPGQSVWVSADGLTWKLIPELSATQVLVAESPAGLVAMTVTQSNTAPPTISPETVWTSTDGTVWHNNGTPIGLANVTSIAGTPSGLVALQGTDVSSGSMSVTYGVAYSTDGLRWTTVSVDPSLNWTFDRNTPETSMVPVVQAGNGHLFLMFGDKGFGASTHSVVWWSVDGRTWTRSTGTISQFGSSMDFGRDGILLYTGIATAGTNTYGFVVSTDGGMSWQPDDSFGPLGLNTCGQVACVEFPNGAVAANGTYFVAVRADGQAWTSYDAKTWTSIPWSGPIPKPFTLAVLPRGVMSIDQYGAAK
jgi:hypothetical protein